MHDLATAENGEYQFAEVRTFATAWHRLGQVAPEGENDSEHLMSLSHLGAEEHVSLREVFLGTEDGTQGIRVPNSWAIVRDRDNRVFAPSVGRTFVPLQNTEAFKAFDALNMDGRMLYEAAGAILGGSRVFILGRLGPDFLVGGKDAVTPYVLMVNNHDGKGAVIFRLVTTRVVCKNTLAVAMGEKTTEYRIRHSRLMDSRLADASKALDLTTKTQARMFEAFNRMADTTGGQKMFEKVANIVLPKPAETATDRIKDADKAERLALWKVMQEEPTTKLAGGMDNRWGIFNGISHWIDWDENRKGSRLITGTDAFDKNLEKRAVYSFEGKGADIRQTVFNTLMKGIEVPA